MHSPKLYGNLYGADAPELLVAIRATDENDALPNMWLVYGFDSESEQMAFYNRAKDHLIYNAVVHFRRGE
ncbi:MAG: hypothetical protein NUW37_13330 [Planctomycetes bacterium]|nr:hypothetical protein [Planctomycetota bacterium]